jgi:SAM-dependent methyltransferase
LLQRIRARLSSKTPPPDPSTQAPEDAWQAALDGEVGFWRNWLRDEGGRFAEGYKAKFNPDLPLQPEIADLIEAPEGSTVKVLDVGAGPLTFVGRKDPRWNIELSAVDALGDEYAALIAEFDVTPPVRTDACETEHLADRFPADTFDVITARNTLDHSYDPLLAIDQMLHCVKPGSALLLLHRRNEADREGFRGMHQWNFAADGDQLVVSRPGTRTDVGEYLAGRATIERSWLDDPWEHVVIRKAAASG